jgi:hypothetical protein
MFSLLDAAATDGRLSSIDPALADTIPKRGEFIDNPHEE